MGFAVDEETIRKYKRAGEITGNALKYGASLVKPGVSVVEVLDKIEERIELRGAGLAFPAAASINYIAAHSAPVDESEVFHEGDVVKLDIGGEIDGFVADTALTVDLGNHEKLLEASKSALYNTIKLVKTGVDVRSLSREINRTITSFGYSPIKNLTGHGLDKYVVHDEPAIPAYDTGNSIFLEENQVIAIEPFASSGVGVVVESGEPTIFMLDHEKPVRSLTARRILKEIKSLNGLPFTIRWFYSEYPKLLVNEAFREFRRKNMLVEFPPLVDMSKGLVAQFEHTMIVKGDKVIVTTMVK